MITFFNNDPTFRAKAHTLTNVDTIPGFHARVTCQAFMPGSHARFSETDIQPGL